MDEASALRVVAARAVETADAARTIWSDADRAWASRAAAEVVGADAAPETFLARRAMLAIERLGTRHPALVRTVRALRWRRWVGTAVMLAAVVIGFFLDQIDSAKRINILAPPVLGLLVWNLVVYVAIAAGYVVRYGEAATPGPLRSAIARLAGGPSRPRRGGAIRDAMVAFVDDWSRRAAPLYAVRAARILHVAAGALAIGVIAGLYVRGLALEYRASWESTFLDAPQVRTIVAVAYAPGALVTGIAVPNVEQIAAIRSPAGENAARWLHLMAATVLVVVIAPRVLLALLMGVIERHRAARFALPLDEPYFQRLLRGYRGGPARVRVIPYSYTPEPEAIAGLEAVAARAFGGSATMTIAEPIAYGADDALVGETKSAPGATLIALFNATATPEREVHGVFLATLARTSAEAVLALIDEGPLVARWPDEPARIANRRAAWREVAEEARVTTIFVDLAAPDLGAVESALDSAFADASR